MTTVLLVEDDRAVSEAVAMRLQANGFDVTQTYDAATATMAIRKAAPDVALLDINMPAGNGFVVAERLKRLDSSTPFIFMTASNREESRTKALSMGAKGYLEKPFSAQALLTAIEDTVA